MRFHLCAIADDTTDDFATRLVGVSIKPYKYDNVRRETSRASIMQYYDAHISTRIVFHALKMVRRHEKYLTIGDIIGQAYSMPEVEAEKWLTSIGITLLAIIDATACDTLS